LTVLSLTLREMRAHARRLAGTALAVVLGVAFLTGTLVLGDTLRANFDDLLTEVNAGTDVVVRNGTELDADVMRAPIDASVVGAVAGVDGVAAAEGVVDGFGQLLGADGDAIGGNGPPQLAGSWITDPALNPYRLAEGRAPRGGDEVVVNRGAAEAGDLQVGDTTTLLTPEPVQVTIVGLATFGDADGLGGVTYTAFDLGDAQRHVLGSPDAVSSVAVQGEDGLDQSTLADRIDDVLPAGVEATTGARVTDEATEDINRDFLDLLTTFLTMFAGVALLVATFSIYNTFSIIVAQRTRQAALLRALGAGRAQVVRSVVAEALLVGVAGSLAGLAAGVGVAGLLKGLFDAAGFALPAGGIVISGGTVAVGVVVGTLVTLVAGIVPAVKASRVAPLAALRDAAAEKVSPSAARVAAGALLSAAGVGLTMAAVIGGGALPVVGLGAVLTVVGAVVSGPAVARPVAAVLGAPLARLRGMTGGLARENAMRNPRRTAGTASALMVGVAVVTLFTVFAASLKASIDQNIDRSFGGDVVVSSGRFGDGGISPALAADVGALPEVDLAVGVGRGAVQIDGDTKEISVAEPAALDQVLDVDVTAGSLADMGDRGLAVSDRAVEDNGWALGDRLPVTFADGSTEDLTIEATYGAGDMLGSYVLPRVVWEPHAVQDADTLVLVRKAPGTSVAEAEAAVTDVAAGYGSPEVADRDEFAATAAGNVDMLLTIIYALLALAIVIALMGIANTLSLSIHERTRELGLLRAVGQTRRQVRAMVRGESVLIAGFGAVGGIALGVFLGWALVRVAGDGTGMVDAFALPTGRLAVVLVVGALAGVVAGLRPARRAARMDVLAAIATE
jgi:putative ABC transport system permease protein